MSYPLIIEPEAERDLLGAFHWYESRRPGLGLDFLLRVQAVFDRISSMPELHAVVYKNLRQTLVRRFPYVACYLFEDDKVYVVAVFHGHRDPDAWKPQAR
jgi:toxin ParE1/3/4